MYTFEGRVRYSECDEHGNLTLLNLINYLQDCSTFQSESIGRGVGYMSERGLAWLIASWQIEIERLPHFCDSIRVSTWCHGMSRSIASRNFTISDTSGNLLVRANSQWFIYDFVHARPIRIPNDQLVYVTGEDPLDMPAIERRLRAEGPFMEASSITVSEQHLDSNRHVNNAQYIGMATNALAGICTTDNAIRPTEIRRICIQYRHQALLGDIVVPHVHMGEVSSTIDLTNPEGESYAIVRIEKR